MGTKGRSIVSGDVNEIINLLNRAYADEWLAYYHYWLCAKISRGPMKDAVNAELIQHAADELRHADMLAMRILALGGTPLSHPGELLKQANSPYPDPKDPSVLAILDQVITAEQGAIEVYHKLLNTTRERDPVTYNIILQLLSDEVQHEEDLQELKTDITALFSTIVKS